MKKCLGIIGGLLVIIPLLFTQNNYNKQYIRQWLVKKPASAFDSLMQQGMRYSDIDTAKANYNFSQAIDLTYKNLDYANSVIAHVALGEMYIEKQAFRRAHYYFFRAKNIASNIPTENLELGLATYGIARVQYFSGNYRTGVLNFLATIYNAQQRKDRNLEAKASEFLGLIYGHFQNFEESIAYFRKCYDLKKILNDDNGCLQVCEKLGDIYYFNRKYDSAYYYINLSVRYAETLQLQNDIHLTRLNKAATLIRLKRLEDANDELQYFSTNKINKTQAALNTRFLTVQGNYWLQKGEKNKALRFYDTAITLAVAKELPELYSVVYRNMGEAFYAIKDYKTAYDYAQKYSVNVRELGLGVKTLNLESVKEYLDLKSSKDEIAVLNNEKKLKELELLNEATLRQSLEQENRFKDSLILRGVALQSSLDKNYQLQQAQLKNERNLRLSLIIGLSTALLLSGLAFFLYQKQRNKNIIIEKQAAELETLMKEIHHRVKNNLQVISSLLDLQAMTIQDEKAAGAVKEGKNRVQSMALIHQNLYNDGNIKGIKIEEYIHNLAHNLFASYNIQPDKITLKTDIDPLNLDVDTVIPIGLTINELISNSLKYAFTSTDLGIITVTLKQEQDNLLLKVKDNGIGFKEGYDRQGSSFGFKMIKAFAQKLKAKLEIFNDNGACVEMRITKYKMA